MSLAAKSLTQLRGIAQALSVPDVFQKDKAQLVQAIEAKQDVYTVSPKEQVAPPAYDARLMTRVPSRKSDREEAEEVLRPYIDKGLKFTIDENSESWKMSFEKKTDEGTMRMPLRILTRCAAKIME